MTILAALVLGAVAVVLAAGLLAGATLAVGAVRQRRLWSVVTGTITATGPEGELQDPQYAGLGTTTDGGDAAGDTAIAVVGAGIKPFANRAPLSVPRTEHSQRHG